GPAADIYSLGAILYAVLTGRPPFQSANVMDTLVAVLEQEPVAPRQLNPGLDQDLETICLKCLEKDAGRRYATADELVDELGRYLNGEPIHARPIGKLERGWRWCKRKPALAGLSALAMVLLLTLGIGGPLVALQQADNARQQTKLRGQADAERTKAEQALSAQVQAERERQQAELERRVAQARSLRQATPQAAATILQELDLGSIQIQDTLRSQLSDNSLSPLEINRIRLGLLSVDAEQLEPIVEFVLSASGQRLKPDELLLIRDVLAPHGTDLTARFLPSLKNTSDRLRAGCLLAGFAADGDFWPAHADHLAADLARVLPSELTAYREALRPVREHLITPLSAIYRDDSSGEQVRSFATDTLADYLSDDAGRLFDLLADSSEQQFGTIFDKLTAHQQQAIELGNAEVARTFAEDASEADKEGLAVRQTNAAVLLLRMNAADQVWPLLKHSPD
ncbi:MAG: hypothetical protein GY758_32395, partial [Fuerstiella sp.]|nr:hypothetical protein [Fuerstiella sp.]